MGYADDTVRALGLSSVGEPSTVSTFDTADLRHPFLELPVFTQLRPAPGSRIAVATVTYG